MEYILADKSEEGCIFCPGNDRGDDEDRLILQVGPSTIVLMNKFPYNNGHLLVAPLDHVSGMEGLSDDKLLNLMQVLQNSLTILREVMNPEGFNVGLNLGRAAGAGMEEHLHFHIVPRWNGDNNFMAVFDDVRVVPEHIRATYRRLKPLFNKKC